VTVGSVGLVQVSDAEEGVWVAARLVTGPGAELFGLVGAVTLLAEECWPST
jgi:hypothetical protein